MQRKLDNRAFTFVEIIVVTTIIWILATIGFTSFIWNISVSRDSLRKTNMWDFMSAMKTYKQDKWSYPIPANYFSWSIDSKIVFWQWKLNKNVSLSTIDEIYLDPLLKIPYIYSITANKSEFEITSTLENEKWDSPLSLTVWNYKSVSKNLLPTIVVATWSISWIDVSDNNNLFIFDNQNHNLAYDFEWNNEPISDWTDLNTLLTEAENKLVFSQNSSYETCLSIRKDWKSIWDWEYQVRTNTWSLTNTWCTDM